MVSLNYVIGFLALAPFLAQAKPTPTSSAPLAKRSPRSCFDSGQWGYIRDVVSACNQAKNDFSNVAISKSHPSQKSYGPYNTHSGNRAYVDIRVENQYGSQYETVHSNDIAFACNEITQFCVGSLRDTRGGYSIQGPFKIFIDVNNCKCN